MDSFLEQQKQDLNKRLRPQLAGELRLDAISRKLYSTDASIYQMQPLGVVLPRTTEDVIATIKAASELKIPLTPRGGGTSLAGQSIGPGLIIDCSKYLNRILDLDPTQQSARIQPGVVLDGLNRAAEKFDLQFGPDVSTSNRANLGGMMGNNSAGARSIHYGKTIDHVLSQKVILSDGSQADLAPLSDEDWKDPSRCAGLLGRIIRGTRQIIEEHRGEIFSRFPRLLRRVSGYNLDILAGVPVTRPPHAPKQDPGLHHLVVGSEGTLAFCVEARVNLVHKPRFRGLLVPQFESLASALQALSVCLEPGPSAVELLDHYLLELTRGNLALRDTTRHLDSRTKAIFMVEFSSEEAAEVEDQVQKLAQRLRSAPGLITTTNAVDPAIRDPLWNLRRASMPLLYGMVGDAKPITFIEDPAVPPERLPEFVSRFKEILQRHNADGSFYGHASVGCLHIRPVMNLKDPAQVAAMPRILEEVTDLILLHGGSLSGEHGDGFSRSQWNRKMFGSKLYDAFCQIKQLFDPQGLFNPGRIVHGPPMTDNLRYPPGYSPVEPTTVMDYSAQAGFLRAIEMCNGSGACRKTQGGTMCPSFRVTLDEQDSPRGRANALRHALADLGNRATPGEISRTMRQTWLQDVFDLCVMCKACKSECPSNVDVAKLKAEWMQIRYRGRVRPLEHWLVAGLPYINRWAAPIAALVNWIQSRPSIHRLLEAMAGLDRRRNLPRLHADHFRKWFRRHQPDPQAGTRGKVVIMADCFTTYFEPGVGQAATEVLERAGYEVQLAEFFCCGRTLISKGFLDKARNWVKSQVQSLARMAEPGVPILGLEPSCLLTLRDEWPDLLPGEATRTLAQSAHLADVWLAQQFRDKGLPAIFGPGQDSVLIHGHCHQKALLGTASTAAGVSLVEGLKVETLDSGCCGMAGSFGMEREHYEVSRKMADLSLLPALAAKPDATVIASGISCRQQIHDFAGRGALHPMEFLRRHLNAASSPPTP